MKLISVFLISTTIFYCVSDRGNTHYDNLKCEGEIPSMFVDGLDDYVKLQDEIYKDYFDNDKDLDKLKEKLILGSALNHSFYFRSGLILFGDPVTNYLNKMKDVLLKEHDLKDKISIYTLRSSEVNAFCALDGNVYFTLGLISRANSEAELAFVLSHEISHYLLKHSLEQLKSEKEIDQMRKDRNKLSLDDMLKFKLKRKRSHEFEADSLGFAIFNKSPYFNKGAIGVLNFLSTSHVPLGEKPFDPEFFSADFFKIPACFFKDEVLEVEARESIEDEYLTHPDIKKRKEKINHFIDNKVKGVEFVNNKKEFDNIKKLATYEMVHRLLVARKYGDAIYTAFNLLQQYPDDEFLNLCLAKGLYGASVYKNNQKYHFVASRYTSKQGESQQIHYLLKHLTARQLNTLTLKYIYSLKKKYPQSHFLGLLENSLVEELVLKHNLTLDDFYSIKDAENQYVLYFDKPSDEANSKIKQRQEYKNFYLLAFAKEREDKALQQKFLMAKEKLEEKEAYKALSYKEKMKLYKDSEKVKKKEGYGIKADDILLFEPEYFKFEKEIEESLEATVNEKAELMEALLPKLSEYNKNIKIFTASKLTRRDAPLYNDYSCVASWVQERESHLGKVAITPVMAEALLNNQNLSSFRYICTMDILKYRNKLTLYVFYLYDKETGEKIYSRVNLVEENVRLKKLLKDILSDFENILN